MTISLFSQSITFSTIISLTSISATLIVAYFSIFKKSKPSVLMGSKMEVYSTPFNGAEGTLWGGTGIYIPMTFFNWSPNGGSIIESRVMIARVDNPNEIFDLSWYEFHEMLQGERRMGCMGFAQPIPIPPKSSVTKTVLFVWLPSNDKRLAMLPGRYSLHALFWTRSSLKPSINQSFEFSITQKQSDDFNFYLKSENSSTVAIPIRETNRQNSILTQDQVRRLYGL